MPSSETNEDAQILALRALAWCVEDSQRAQRLLSLTGLTTNDLRARAAAPECQSAVLGFLESHEPDLLACAEALDVKPAALVRARQALDA